MNIPTTPIRKSINNPREITPFIWNQWIVPGLQKTEAKLSIGSSIFEFDWDVLVVLDACRYDLFKKFAPKYDLYNDINDIDSIYSVTSTTQTWFPRTFDSSTHEKVEDTHYVTSTSYASRFIESNDLYQIDHVWRYGKDPETGLT